MMGSRDQLCVNKNYNFLKGEALNFECNKNKQSCQFYHKDDSTLEMKMKGGEVYDIEDLYKTGQNLRSCPYFATKNAVKWAEIILMPYTYITDMWIREDHKELLKGSVVIFDEAHNIPSTAERGSSFSMTILNLEGALEEIKLFEKLKEKSKGNPKITMNLVTMQHIL